MISTRFVLCFVMLFPFLFFGYASGHPNKPKGCMDWNKNTLISGKDNNIYIRIPGHEDDTLNVTVDQGGFVTPIETMDGTPVFYNIRPYGTTTRITVIVKSQKGDTIYCEKTFKVIKGRKTEKPTVFFGDYSGGAIPAAQAGEMREIKVRQRTKIFHKPEKYTVISYTLAIAPKNGSSYIEPVRGNEITTSGKLRLQDLKQGDLIVIANVEAEGPNGKMILPGVTLTVK
jgi:hypothetical protein